MCALVTGVQTCALPIWLLAIELTISLSFEAVNGGPRAGLSPVHPNPAAGTRRRNGARSAPRTTAAAGLRPRRVRAGRRRQGWWRPRRTALRRTYGRPEIGSAACRGKGGPHWEASVVPEAEKN